MLLNENCSLTISSLTYRHAPRILEFQAFLQCHFSSNFGKVQIGFLIYIPFLILDMVVASILLSMGMMMLPPVLISLPFKLMLFVMVDGWYLTVGSLMRSFGV